MTDLDTGPSSIRDDSICESSLPPNKSSGDIVELKPCPFCGKPPRSIDAELFDGAAMVWCASDDCMGPRTTAGNMRDATVQWNTRAPDPESAAEIERLRREVRDANRHWNERCVELSVNAHGWMKAHDQLLGFIQSRPELLKVMMTEKPEIKYPSPADVPELVQRALTAESAVAAAWEEAAKIADLHASSMEEREADSNGQFHDGRDFACESIASAIRTAGSKKTAESGHSSSTDNSESE